MSYVCPICALTPSSHSLAKVLEREELICFYTCPSKAILYHDVSGIIHHYNGILSEIPENKEWIWIFDSVKFGLVHTVQTTVAIELAKLITQKFICGLLLQAIIILRITLI
jgi:hypothetical protein